MTPEQITSTTRQPMPPSPHHAARWGRIHALYNDLQPIPRSDWHALLTRECGDDAGLAYEVLSLLVADETAREACEAPSSERARPA